MSTVNEALFQRQQSTCQETNPFINKKASGLAVWTAAPLVN